MDYSIAADTDYLTDHVINGEPAKQIKLAKMCWADSEHLWRGMIPKAELTFDADSLITNDVELYFQEKKYNVEYPNDYVWHTDDMDRILETVAKFVWLTGEYLSNGGLNNPLMSHYNPRIDSNVIHPGGCRNRVIKLFHEQEFVDCIYFNTRGCQPTWLKDLSKITVKDVINDNWIVVYVPDHGSFIPHLLKDLDTIPSGIESAHKMIHKKLTGNFKVHTNRHLTYLDPWESNDVDCDVKIYFKTKPIDILQVKVTVLALLGISARTKDYIIECN